MNKKDISANPAVVSIEMRKQSKRLKLNQRAVWFV